jgi:hypothetical protein
MWLVVPVEAGKEGEFQQGMRKPAGECLKMGLLKRNARLEAGGLGGTGCISPDRIVYVCLHGSGIPQPATSCLSIVIEITRMVTFVL